MTIKIQLTITKVLDIGKFEKENDKNTLKILNVRIRKIKDRKEKRLDHPIADNFEYL